MFYKFFKTEDADMGIRTPVLGVRGRNDWPDYTISAKYYYVLRNADMGIRTPVLGVKGRNDWPDYTISALVL